MEIEAIKNELWEPISINKPLIIEIDTTDFEENATVLKQYPVLNNAYRLEVIRDSEFLTIKGKLYVKCIEKYSSQFVPTKEQEHGYVQYNSLLCDTRSGKCSLIFDDKGSAFLEEQSSIVIFLEILKITFGETTDSVTTIKEYYTNVGRHRYKHEYKVDITVQTDEYLDSEKRTRALPTRSICGYCTSFKFRDENILMYDVPTECSEIKNTATIEYMSDVDKENREIIADCISFFHGKELIKLCEKRIDKKGRILCSCITPASGSRFGLQQTSGPIGDPTKIDDAIQNGIAGFFNAYKKYDLYRVLRMYWDATTQYMDVAIIQYQAAIEILVESHFGNNKDLLITEKELKKLCGNEIESIYDKIKNEYGSDVAESIKGGIKDAIRMSKKRKLNKFGEDLKVVLTKEELKIVKEAPKIRHGGKMEFDQLVETYMFYTKYCNRLIMGLIDYSSNKQSTDS